MRGAELVVRSLDAVVVVMDDARKALSAKFGSQLQVSQEQAGALYLIRAQAVYRKDQGGEEISRTPRRRRRSDQWRSELGGGTEGGVMVVMVVMGGWLQMLLIKRIEQVSLGKLLGCEGELGRGWWWSCGVVQNFSGTFSAVQGSE